VLGPVIVGLVLVGLGASACEDRDEPPAEPCASPTLTGTAEDDRITGTSGPDVIDGGEGNDRIRGLGGDDILCGGQGADLLDGGEGEDRLFGEADWRQEADTDHYEWTGDALSGGPGDDLLDGGYDDDGGETRLEGDSLDFRRSDTAVRVDLAAGTATGEGQDTLVTGFHSVVGSRGDDVLMGTDAKDRLIGWSGADRLVGGNGKDELYAHVRLVTTATYDDSRDELFGGGGNDLLSGAEGDETLAGGPGNDTLVGDMGSDRLFGGADNDKLTDDLTSARGQLLDGGTGRDGIQGFFLVRPDGRDIATSGAGTVDLAAGLITTRVDGIPVTVVATGLERATATFGSWNLIGTDSPNRLAAWFDTSVVIRAGGGNDNVHGSDQRDDLDGGPGRDTLTGTPGGDRVVGFEQTR